MIYTGEAMPLEWVARMQMGDAPVLYRPRYGNRDLDFKTISANLRQPEIMTVGSSRVLQFRSQFFDQQPREFYNAGAPAWTLDQVVELLQRLDVHAARPDHRARSALVQRRLRPRRARPQVSDFAHLFMVNRSFMQDVIGGEIDSTSGAIWRGSSRGTAGWRSACAPSATGTASATTAASSTAIFWSPTGSIPQNERQRHLDDLRDGKEMYVYGDTVSAARLAAAGGFAGVVPSARHHRDRLSAVVHADALPADDRRRQAQLRARSSTRRCRAAVRAATATPSSTSPTARRWARPTTISSTAGTPRSGSICGCTRRCATALPDLLGAYSDPAYLAQAADASATDTFDVFGNAYPR